METVAIDISGGGFGGLGAGQNGFRAFREQFTGDTVQTTFQLTGAIENATFVQGAWNASNIDNSLNSHAVNQSGRPIYKTVILGIGTSRIEVVSISATGLVTLNHPPRSEDFDIWYWYKLAELDELEDYVREDFVASMEADNVNLINQIDTKITKVPSAVDNNIALWGGTGELKDSGSNLNSLKGANLTILANRKNNATNSYLRYADNMSNVTPVVVHEASYINSISASTDGNETWTVEIHNSSGLISGAVLSISGNDSGFVNNLNIPISSGTRLSVYCNGINIKQPTVVFTTIKQ